MNKNIALFKKFYFLLIIFCSFIQIIISETIDDYIILGMVISLNLLILFYCIDENKFYKFPISLSIIFFSVFFNSSSSLFFKTLELDKVSSNLLSAMNTYTFIFYANIIIVITHFFYQRINKSINNNFFFNLNHRLSLFNVDSKFLFLLGSFAIFSKLLIQPFFKLEWSVVSQSGLPLAFDILKGFDVFYLFPFILILSTKLFKKEFKIKKLTLVVLFIAVIIISIGSNRRDFLFFALLCFVMTLFIVYLLDLIKLERKNYFFLILTAVIVSFTYQQIIAFNKIYTYERGLAIDRSRVENIKSFYVTLNEVFSGKLDMQTYEGYAELMRDQNTEISKYYNSLIFERVNSIQYSDNALNFYNKSNKKDINKVKEHSLNRIISIAPQFIINIFTNNFHKKNYVYLSSASLMNKTNNLSYFSINDVGSSLAEMKIIFGIFFFLPLIIISYFAFFFFDSFYDVKKKIFSPVIVVLFYFSGASVLNFFASTSFDLMVMTFLRELPQTIILFSITYFLYKKLSRTNNIKA